MDEETATKKPYHLPDMSVIVTNTESYRIKAIAVDRIDITKLTGTETPPFTPIRLIANLAIVPEALALEDYTPESALRSFEYPIKFHVSYNIQDLFDCAIEGKKLKLAYWNGTKWVLISDDENDAFEYRILPPSTAQVAEFTVSDWNGDPPLAWGK